MSAKVLVVDDSLTIQKVVSITLAKSGYTLVAAHDEDELFNELEKEVFDLILLDFNLSESLSGYELAKKIKEKAKKSNLLAMIGTFDNVNDVEMTESGIDASIIKPFESTKFIEMCESLIGESAHSSHDSESMELSLDDDSDDENDGWETSSSFTGTDTLITKEEELVKDEPITNSLKEEIEGWGMSLPDIIEASEVTRDMEGSNILMPPKINSEEVEFSVLDDNQEEGEIVPEIGKEVADDDLLFPETNDALPEEGASSKLSSLSELNLEEDNEITLSVDDFDESNEDLIKEFESDEDEEFWATEDEEENNEVGPKLEAIESLDEEVGPKLEKISTEQIDIDQIVERLKSELSPMIEELIEQKISSAMSETIERVAWEAIPDMAENLVRNEVKEISQKIQDKHSL